MAIDRWFIGGGAEHTPESARRLVYASTGGSEGVGGVNDLKVMPLAVPGGGVRVVVGSALIKSRYIGGETQTYMGTVYQEETVSVAATGSGAGRSDLVVMRVEDPFAAGSPWDTPTPIETSPYIHIRVISGVPAGTTRLQDVPGYTNDTALTLARIDIPASTGTIIPAMIIDLRKLAQPRTQTYRHRENAPAENADMSSSTFVQWPPVGIWVAIPEWATHVWLNGELAGANAVNSAISGEIRLRFGPTIVTNPTAVNEQTGFGSRINYPLGSKLPIPESMRGTSVQIIPQARRTGGSGLLRSYWGTVLTLDLLWVEEAI